MAIKISNPLRAVWGYLRGDDLMAADARAVAAHAALAADRPPATEEATSAQVPARGTGTGTLSRAGE